MAHSARLRNSRNIGPRWHGSCLQGTAAVLCNAIVALKMFRNWGHASQKQTARFRAEADLIAHLQHPNIVQIYDVGEVAGKPYFVLEYVPGGNLAQHVNGTPQSARLAAQFVEILARAVQAAHANNVIHRDLKAGQHTVKRPRSKFRRWFRQNSKCQFNSVCIGELLNAIPKIADFGVAKRASGDWEAQGHMV